jgi:Abortive infection C-terminus
LHSVFGEYVKRLKESGQIHAPMTERILRSSISVFEAFNEVRNNRSLAHDNPTLNYEESLLILNHVAATIRFIKSVEMRTAAESEATNLDDDIPY